MFHVAKSFHTVNRRFKEGDEIGPHDIQGDVPFEVWIERGFIAADAKKSSGPKTEKKAA